MKEIKNLAVKMGGKPMTVIMSRERVMEREEEEEEKEMKRTLGVETSARRSQRRGSEFVYSRFD